MTLWGEVFWHVLCNLGTDIFSVNCITFCVVSSEEERDFVLPTNIELHSLPAALGREDIGDVKVHSWSDLYADFHLRC